MIVHRGDDPADRDAVLGAVATQIGWCRALDAPFTAGLLGALHANIARGGALAALVVPWRGRPIADALPIRLAGAFHALARSGRFPELTTLYARASVRGSEPAWDEPVIAVLVEDVARAARDAIADFLTHPPQTNEVGRSAILMPGYAVVARVYGAPLRILELGASAGLNLNWDRYAHRLGERFVGPADAAVTLAPEWQGTPPDIDALPAVTERRGCDRSPIELGAPGAVDRLLAYVWPDHAERVRRLAAAIAVAAAAPPPVDAADAGDWLVARLAERAEGVATVVAHTIAWQYFGRATVTAAHRAIAEAGARATAAAPLARLAFELPRADAPPELTLTTWPGGTHRLLARAHPHGAWIAWCG